MSDTAIHRITAPSAIRGRLGLGASLATIRAWFTAQRDRETSLIAGLDRHHRDMVMLQELGMTRGEVTRMIDRPHR